MIWQVYSNSFDNPKEKGGIAEIDAECTGTKHKEKEDTTEEMYLEKRK